MESDTARIERIEYTIYGTNGEGLAEKAERIETKIDAGMEKLGGRVDRLMLAILGAQMVGGALAAAMVKLLA